MSLTNSKAARVRLDEVLRSFTAASPASGQSEVSVVRIFIEP
jgi:hypothetical protein